MPWDMDAVVNVPEGQAFVKKLPYQATLEQVNQTFLNIWLIAWHDKNSHEFYWWTIEGDPFQQEQYVTAGLTMIRLSS